MTSRGKRESLALNPDVIALYVIEHSLVLKRASDEQREVILSILRLVSGIILYKKVKTLWSVRPYVQSLLCELYEYIDSQGLIKRINYGDAFSDTIIGIIIRFIEGSQPKGFGSGDRFGRTTKRYDTGTTGGNSIWREIRES